MDGISDMIEMEILLEKNIIKMVNKLKKIYNGD